MLEQYLSAIIYVTGVFVGVALLAQIFGVNLYNIRVTRLLREQARHPHAARYRRRPLVSVIITAQNHDQTIVDCLESILRGKYRKVEVIVADNVSTDNTKQLVKDAMQRFPRRTIHMLAKRKSDTLVQLQKQAYKKYGSGEIIFTLGADELVDAQAIRQAVMHFNREDQLDGLYHHQSVQVAESMRGLFQKYQWFLRHRSYKVNDAFGLGRYAQVSTIWRKQAWLARKGTQQLNSRYAHDVVVSSPAKPLQFTYPYAAHLRMRKLLRIPMASAERLLHLLVAFMGVYSVYIAARFHEATLLITAWLLVTVVLALAIWDDGHLGWRQKIGYTIGIPLSYIVLAITGLFQAAGAVLPARWLSSDSNQS